MSPFGRLLEMLDMDWDDDRARRRRGHRDDDFDDVERDHFDRDDDWDRSGPRGRQRREGGLMDIFD
jgi:hypothetical protein